MQELVEYNSSTGNTGSSIYFLVLLTSAKCMNDICDTRSNEKALKVKVMQDVIYTMVR